MTPERWYRLLLALYPRWFRRRYGEEMVRAFRLLLERAGERGGAGARIRTWIGAGVDAARRGIGLRLRGSRGRRGGGDRGNQREPGEGMMKSVLSDVRFGLRALLRRPVFSATAVAALALGIGATTTIFSVVNGILLKPMPYEQPDRLVALWAAHPERGWSHADVSMPEAWEWGQRSDALAEVIIHDNGQAALTGGDRPEMASVVFTTPNIFDVLGVEPARGRGFLPEDNREGAEGVVVLAHDFWQARFGGDPEILGRTVVLEQEPHTVVGVLPEGFFYADEFADLYVPWRRDVAGEVASRASVVLMAAAGFILLMACVNVANLLLARANGRRREIAIRAAMGAGRGRVARQLLVESGALAGVGGALGLLFSLWGTRAVVSRMPEFMPPILRFGVDWRVLVFAAGASLGAVLLFGLTPALRASRVDPDALRDGGRGAGSGRGSRRFGSTLVVVQTAVAMVLLVAGGVLLRSVASMQSLDLGYDTEGILAVGLNPSQLRYPEREDLQTLYDEVERRVRAEPGVESVGWIHSPPMAGSNWSAGVRIPGLDIAGEEEGLSVRLDYVSPGYLETMGISVLRGRPVRESDGEDAPPVVVVNEVFVERYLGGRDALSYTVEGLGDEPRTIVGVVEATVERTVDRPAVPTVFVPQAQRPTRRRHLMLRTAGAPAALSESVQRAIWDVDPDLPVLSARTMEELVSIRVSGFRLIAQLMGSFAVLALVLGAVGIYGVTSYAVSRRTGEIGVRMAMGADRGRVRLMVVRDGAVRAALGLGAGVVLAFFLTRALESFLVGVTATDPLTFGTVAAVLGGVTLLAAYLPARRASAIDPVRALTRE